MIRGVKGTKDILPDEVGAWQLVEAEARRLFALYGYREIRTPIFEKTELFARSIGAETDIVAKEMYSFVDRAAQDSEGESLTLRPEATAGILRAVIEHSLTNAEPELRLYAIGPMFRRERPQKGRYRQFHQVDVEAFGMAEPTIDAEVISLGLKYLQLSGVTDLSLVLNSVGDQACRPQYVQALREALQSNKAQMCDDCQRRADKNPLRVLDCKVPQDQPIIEALPRLADHLCAPCREHYTSVKDELDLLGIQYRESHRLVRGLDYYTRTTFEVTSSSLGAQNSVLGGGRYDGLINALGGPDLPAIGFALGIERLVMLSGADLKPRRCHVFVAPLVADGHKLAVTLQKELRDSLPSSQVLRAQRPRSAKAQVRRGGSLGARFVCLLGDDELARREWTVKDMDVSSQERVPFERILPYLRERLEKLNG